MGVVHYLDATRPVIRDVAEWARVLPGDPRSEGLMARRWEAWQYYRDQGYECGFGGYGGGAITVAGEITSGAAFEGLAIDPEGARRLLERIVEAEEHIARFAAELTPDRIRERLRVFAGSGCKCVQLYPGRGTPARNLETAIAACREFCPGGPAW